MKTTLKDKKKTTAKPAKEAIAKPLKKRGGLGMFKGKIYCDDSVFNLGL